MPVSSRIIITRPAAQSTEWLDGLAAQGLSAQSFPLIEITDALSPQQRAQLHARAAHADVCMWVSRNAVACFWKKIGHFSDVDTEKYAINSIVNNTLQRHWATGPGTVAELVRCGVAMTQIDAPELSAQQWDTQTLWQSVKGQIRAGSQVLILRGEDVGTPSASRDWLAQQIRAAGGVVEFAAVYQRRPPQFTQQKVAWAHAAANDGSLWVFSSSQAVAHLPDIAGGWGQARCIATHPRIAQAAHAKGLVVVCTSRPALADVAQSIKSVL